MKVFRLGDIYNTTSGGTPSRRNPEFYNGSIPWVKSGELESNIILDTEEKITEEAIKNSSAKVFPKGTLLIALYGATIGKLAKLGIDAATNQAVCGIFENDEHDIQYLYWFLYHKRRDLINAGIGGAQPNISQTILKNLHIPLPGKQQQQAIVSKLEELFSKLDNGIESLKTIQHQLKVYRQAVLKWAFEGRLTNNNVKDGELPEGWRIGTIGEILEVFVSSTPSRKNNNYWNGNINWVSSGEVAFCRIKFTKEKISEEGLKNSSCKVHPKGTVILAMIGEGKTRGQAAVLNIEASHNQNTAAIRIPDGVYLSELLYYLFFLKYEENRRIGSGNNQKALNKERVKTIPLPIIPFSEQQLIVQEIESRLSICDKIEETITNALKEAEALRQSILKQAFEGKLV